jgi:fatty-acyl-CoA synthase
MIRAHLAQQFPKWWLPDAIEFVAAIPKTSVGKFQKREIRDRYRDRYAGAADPTKAPALATPQTPSPASQA